MKLHWPSTDHYDAYDVEVMAVYTDPRTGHTMVVTRQLGSMGMVPQVADLSYCAKMYGCTLVPAPYEDLPQS